MSASTLPLSPPPSLSLFRNWLLRSRAWIAISIMVPFALLALASPLLGNEGTWTDACFDMVGWVVFFAGAGMRWWSTLYIGGRKKLMLVDQGPYSVCRNPLYVGTFFTSLALCIFMQSLTFAFGFTLASVIYLLITVPAEERLLAEKLGEPFLDYCRRVPRFFPRLGAFRTDDTISVNVGGLMAEGIRAARWMWIPIAGQMLAQLRAESWWPRLFHLP